MEIATVLALGVTIVVGAAVVIALLVRRLGAAETARAVASAEARVTEHLAQERALTGRLKAELEIVERQSVATGQALSAREREVLEARETIARHQTQAANLEQRIVELNAAREQLRVTFQALSAEALRGNNEVFLQLARAELDRARVEANTDLETRQAAIEQLVSPIRESLSANDAKLHQIEKERVESFGRLMTEVAGVAAASEKLRSETTVLSRALTGTNARGSWGELQLRRVCELAGMIEHCDFTTQETVHGQEGSLRPDLIVKLPAGRTIVVDAKAPATAFLEATRTEDPARQKELIEAHAAHVKKHVDLLSKKSYWEQFDNAPDFVVLFMPNEAFYSAAIQHEPALLEYAVEQRVLIATPVSLIGLLKVVALGWRQERIAESAQEVSDAGRELYDRLRILTDHFNKVGGNLRKSVEAYNSAVGSMEKSVFPQARKFERLGAAGAKPIAETDPIELAPRSLSAPDWVESPETLEAISPLPETPALPS